MPSPKPQLARAVILGWSHRNSSSVRRFLWVSKKGAAHPGRGGGAPGHDVKEDRPEDFEDRSAGVRELGLCGCFLRGEEAG